MRERQRTFARLLAGALAYVLLGPALAQAQLGPEGSPIRTNAYSVDLQQGAVLASSRVTGLAGAYVAIAEGVDGNPMNPAAPSVRVPWSFDHFDYDLGLSFSLPIALHDGDFFNSQGSDRTQSEDQELLFLNAAANLQFGTWGFGLTLDLQQYGLDRAAVAGSAQKDELGGQFALAHLIVSNAFSDGQLLIGAGIRSTALSVVNTANSTDRELFSTTGAGLSAGVLWRPNEERFRVGAAVHSAVTTRPNKDSTDILYEGTDDELWLPNQVTVPWDVNLGVAVQLGPRPFNPRWYDPSLLLARVRRAMAAREAARARRRELLVERSRTEGRDSQAATAAIEAELEAQAALDEMRLELEERRVERALRERVRRMPRSYVLIASSLVISGEAENAVGIESFLDRAVNRSGEAVVVSPRLGVESEVIPEWLKLRAGSYAEPTRFRHGSTRVHGTFGFDLNVLPWSVFGLFHEETEWRLSGALDAAPRYVGGGVSIGMWH
ncbi:MAG TPA: hypothetical protein VK524_20075 [Polyangiaceae bacterium]|nr:hypothetical protein [Polyangiaceae bacterium]